MNELALVILDTVHIQPYIFGSNRLRENIGASFLVARATREQAFEIIMNVAPNNNLEQVGKGKRSWGFTQRTFENENELQVQVLYSGGGNFVALFSDEPLARKFVRSLTRTLLEQAPGLQLIALIRPFKWGKNSGLANAIQDAFSEIARKKSARKISAPLLGLGITSACRSTGLPASGWTDKVAGDPNSVYPASNEILQKRRAVEAANHRLTDQFRDVLDMAEHRLGDKVLFPYEFDHLGRSHTEFSYLAVVHADGNGIGHRFSDLATQGNDNNREYINLVSSMSELTNMIGLEALRRALIRLVKAIDPSEKAIVHRTNAGEVTRVGLYRNQDGWFLPVRPLVYGGDDVTLVCDGRLGLALAIAFMEEFELVSGNANLPDGKGNATACAGVSIVKSHFPFAQAYSFAEDLCKNAKMYGRNRNENNSACLDWHFAVNGLLDGLDQLRQREYSTSNGSLILRPVTLRTNPQDAARAWPVIQRGLEAFQSAGWYDRRSKVKLLREVLRDGPQQVEAYRAKYNKNKPLPEVLVSQPQTVKNGWTLDGCGYFDAIELVDWFIPLPGGSDEN